MPETAPELAIKGVLRAHWDSSQTSLVDDPLIHEGEYQRGDRRPPLIAITGGTEGPRGGGGDGGGGTPYSAIDGAGGGGMQHIDGALTLECVAGTVEDVAGAGTAGANLSPKQVRWDLYKHAAQLLVDYQEETPMAWIGPGDMTRFAQSQGSGDEADYAFWIELRARYSYDRHPNPPL